MGKDIPFSDAGSFFYPQKYKRRRRYDLRIDSYQIGMDSARLYKSSKQMRTQYASTDLSAQGGSDALMSFAGYLGEKNEAAEEETKDGIVTKPDPKDPISLNYLTAKLRNNYINDRNSQSEFKKLHELMVRRIFDLLFPDRYDKHPASCEEVPAYESNNLAYSSVTSYRVVNSEYVSSGYYTESETTSFSAAGTVKTADGRSIDINFNMTMSRSFTSYYEEHYSFTSLNFCDPLVINFDGNLPGLKSGDEFDFFFDLDADGEEEKIARLDGSSAFLALDLNGDGKVNDGSELFGPKSGDGFKDLAEYDEDHNGWIDENDSVFNKLKLWVKDPSGNDILYTLKDKDIGAIFLGSAGTEFKLADMENAALGYVRQTGLFLYEDGTAGTVQHVDLVS